MTRVDLDAIERGLGDLPRLQAAELLGVLAELRAAREVVEAVRDWWYTDAGEDALRAEQGIGQAVKDYDKAVGS